MYEVWWGDDFLGVVHQAEAEELLEAGYDIRYIGG